MRSPPSPSLSSSSSPFGIFCDSDSCDRIETWLDDLELCPERAESPSSRRPAEASKEAVAGATAAEKEQKTESKGEEETAPDSDQPPFVSSIRASDFVSALLDDIEAFPGLERHLQDAVRDRPWNAALLARIRQWKEKKRKEREEMAMVRRWIRELDMEIMQRKKEKEKEGNVGIEGGEG